MIQSDTSNFIPNINNKYKSFKTDILPNFLGKNICDSLNNDKVVQKLFTYQEFLFNYMKDMNKIPEEKFQFYFYLQN